LSSDEIITLDSFKPRDYQKRPMDALFNKGYKRILLFWARRSGKDYLALNIHLRAALLDPGLYYYVFPEYAQAKKVLWRGIDSSGQKFLDMIPPGIIRRTNQQEMSIELKNNSIIQVVGSNKFDSHRGVNTKGIIYSEYCYQDPEAHLALSPALRYNDGYAVFISTVRGRNHGFDLWQIAQANPDIWYSEKLSIADTKHISEEEIQREIDSGEISWDMAQSEYYSNFDIGIEGSYYSKYIDRARLDSRITDVQYENAFRVRVSFDIGNDGTSMIFFFVDGHNVKIIDYYENSGAGIGLEHYAEIFHRWGREKGYIYADKACIFPHDMIVTEWGGPAQTRLQKAQKLGLNGIICDKKEIDDGIEAVRSAFPRIWIDQKRCALLIKHLENYRQEWDSKKSKYKGIPLHDHHSHAADSLRYLCLSLPKTKDGLSAQELDKRYLEHRYGNQHGGFFSGNKF